MEIEVFQKNIPISPKKARVILVSLKNKPAVEALRILEFSPKKTAYYFKKILKNGVAAALDKNLDKEKLYIKSLAVDRAPHLKKIRYQSKGRADMISRRRSHFRMILVEKELSTAKTKPNHSQIKEKQNGPKS